MSSETLEQWANRLHAEHVSIRHPRPQLNRGSLVATQQARLAEQQAQAAHQKKMAAIDAERAVASPAPSPSLGGSFLSRVTSLVLPRQSAPVTASSSSIPASQPEPRRKGLRPR